MRRRLSALPLGRHEFLLRLHRRPDRGARARLDQLQPAFLERALDLRRVQLARCGQNRRHRSRGGGPGFRLGFRSHHDLVRLLALGRCRGGLHHELFCGGHRCRSVGRRGTCCDAVFLAPRCRRWRPAAFTPFAAVAAAAAAALALVIALSRFSRSCVECRRASVLLWTRLARIGPFRGGCAILPLGALAARRPLLSERALRARVTVLTVLALRAFTAVIAAASLTRIRTLVAPAEAIAVA